MASFIASTGVGMRPGVAILILWAAFAVSWLVAAWWSNAVEKQAGVRAEMPYRIILLIGGIIFAIPAHNYIGPLRLWFVTKTEVWICVGLIALGFAFSWWARVHLGALWSGQITRKTDHGVIDTGPYSLVRHPIYTGILLAVVATAVAKGTVFGVAGALTILLGLWMKARLEESWLSEELDNSAYEAYRRRVPMLVPFGPTG
jgi:protein-S-isoprenylcysteine O-methyltransferase Ste14